MITIGIDEVGRGCWAGPLAAAAVALDSAQPVIPGLNDSKKLSRARRDGLDILIRQAAVAYGIGWVEPGAIDTRGITKAVKVAMETAVSEVLQKLDPAAEAIEIIIDGSYDFLKEYTLPTRWQNRVQIRTLVGADGLVPAVSAASIIAKVARDKYMSGEAHGKHPAYGFDKHVGYGTAAHIAALAAHGVTPLHRMSYKPIQKFLLQSGA